MLLSVDAFTGGNSNVDAKVVERMVFAQSSISFVNDERLTSLYSAWSTSLNSSVNGEGMFSNDRGKKRSNVPRAPHLEDCKLRAQVNQHLDKRIGMEKFPRWTIWKGFLNNYPSPAADEQLRYQAISEGAYPPWVCFYWHTPSCQYVMTNELRVHAHVQSLRNHFVSI